MLLYLKLTIHKKRRKVGTTQLQIDVNQTGTEESSLQSHNGFLKGNSYSTRQFLSLLLHSLLFYLFCIQVMSRLKKFAIAWHLQVLTAPVSKMLQTFKLNCKSGQNTHTAIQKLKNWTGRVFILITGTEDNLLSCSGLRAAFLFSLTQPLSQGSFNLTWVSYHCMHTTSQLPSQGLENMQKP